MARRIETLEKVLFGNGRPGIVETVVRIDAGIRLLKWLWIGTVIPFAAAMLYEIIRTH